MENVVFTITENGFGYNITNKKYSTFNKFCLTPSALPKAMYELADVFNNVLNLGICFVVE